MAARSEVASANGSTYKLGWWTVDGGGNVSRGGEYALMGTTGQPDAGVLAGSGYTLSGGFWGRAGPAAVPGDHFVYLPLVLKNR